ncbi:MBL fold metallo-hydrolase [Priestia megaterium]|nr:MBL fold metallo-hydrolase [Priestia megaterium]
MLKKLTNRVYYMPHYSKTDRPTLGLICGDTYSLIIDSGNSPAHAEAFLHDAAKMNIPPVMGVIITHWHWDHTFGMEAMNALTIGHQETKAQLEYMKTLEWDDDSLDARVKKGEEIAFCGDMMKLEMPDRNHLKIIGLDVTFHDKLEIDLGGVTCLLQHVGGVHAKDFIIAYIQEEKVLFLGDCLCPDLYSGEWSYDYKDLNRLLQLVKPYDVEYYVSSHQNPQTDQELWNDVNELCEMGKFVGDEKSVESAVKRFRMERNAGPTEQQMEDITFFVNGNQKRDGIF